MAETDLFGAGRGPSPGRALRAAMAAQGLLRAPGVFDGMSARLAAAAGLPALHASGGAIARAIGYPDMGLVTATEMIARIDEIASAGPPVIADADTGFGGLLNVARTVRAYEKAGVAALHIEDQTYPKRCGLMAGVGVVPLPEARARIVAAVDARSDPETVIIARTDALGAEGLEAACARMDAYLEAGADMAFIEGLETPVLIEAVARRVPGPKLINITQARRGLPMPLDALRDMGFAIAIYPGDVQSAAIAAMAQTLGAIAASGETTAVADRLADAALRDGIVGTAAMVEAEARWSAPT